MVYGDENITAIISFGHSFDAFFRHIQAHGFIAPGPAGKTAAFINSGNARLLNTIVGSAFGYGRAKRDIADPINPVAEIVMGMKQLHSSGKNSVELIHAFYFSNLECL